MPEDVTTVDTISDEEADASLYSDITEVDSITDDTSSTSTDSTSSEDPASASSTTEISSGTTTYDNINLSTAGALKAGASRYGETGIFLGRDGSTFKFSVSGSSGSILFDGSSLTVSGSITATTGTIGGFSIGSDYVRDAANSFGMASTVTAGDDVRFWAGDTFANRATADFRVTESGAVTATSISISGVTYNGSTLTSTGVEIVRGYNLSPNFNIDSQNGSSNPEPVGFSDTSPRIFSLCVSSGGTADDYNVLGYEVSTDFGAAFYVRVDSGQQNTGATFNQAGTGSIVIGTDYWFCEGTGSNKINKNGSNVTISGTARFGSLGHDPSNSYLLILYSSTKIAKFSGISGTTITNLNSDVTLDTAVDNDIGFLYDNTNSRYICVDKTNNLIRRFNSSGTTIDTISYTVDDTYVQGVIVLTGRVHLVMLRSVDVDTRSAYGFADIVPTSMTI